MKKRYVFILILLVLVVSVFFYWNSDKRIIRLLNSDKKNDLILGAYKAGKSRDKKFIPLLLKNADDMRTSTNLQFKGYSVYQEKMIALKKIFNVEPPFKIENKPDSTVIKFYTDLYQKMK